MGDADAVATDGDDRPCLQNVAMPFEQFGNQGDAPFCRHVRQTHQARMRGSPQVDQRSEVGIDRHQYSVLGGSAFEQCPIPWITAKAMSIKHVVTLFA